MVKIKSVGNHLESDGKPFLYLADTWWFGATGRCAWPEPFVSLVKDRRNKGFNAVQIVIGIPPETLPFSTDAKNSGGLPFYEDWSLNKKYFEEADKKINFLIKQGITPVIFGGWGHHIDWMGIGAVKNLWLEIIKRYSNLPVIFCLCGEVDAFLGSVISFGNGGKFKQTTKKFANKYLPTYLFKQTVQIKRRISSVLSKASQSRKLQKRLKDWSEVARFIKNTDKHNNLLMVHLQSKNTARKLFSNPDWMDINTVQSGHLRESASFLVQSALFERQGPFINLEPWYEGILGEFDEGDIRYAFWMSILAGACGIGYGAHGLWQMSKKGEDFMGHWGSSDWQKALSFRGAAQIGLSKGFLEKLQWWKFKAELNGIDYHFSKDNLSGPLLAGYGAKKIIYFPKGRGKKVYNLSGLKKFRYIVYSAKNMKKIYSLKYAYNIKLENTKEDFVVTVN